MCELSVNAPLPNQVPCLYFVLQSEFVKREMFSYGLMGICDEGFWGESVPFRFGILETGVKSARGLPQSKTWRRCYHLWRIRTTPIIMPLTA